MASRTIFQCSPSKLKPSSAVSSPQRAKQPSPQKNCLPYTLVVLPPKRVASATEAGSPVKKVKEIDGKDLIPNTEFDVQLSKDDENLKNGLALAKNIVLSYRLVDNGRATFPSGDWSDLVSLFPTTFDIRVSPPFLVFRVRELPKTTLPFTIAGLPIQLITGDQDEPFNKGISARGSQILPQLDLHRTLDYTHAILLQVIEAYHELKIKISSIFWFGGFWQVSIRDDIDVKGLPYRAAKCPVFYLKNSETLQPVPAALRSKAPTLDAYDDTMYASLGTALLRPGIMLSSSLRTSTSDGKTEEGWKTTTSGILVADTEGELFITVASHGFHDDGLVYHPDPKKGKQIGRVVNQTFGNPADSQGTLLTGLSPCEPPHLRIYDFITMDNPFTGLCEGLTLAVGLLIPDDQTTKFVAHEWQIFENGSEPVDGSCGSPILNNEGRVVGLFRFKAKDSGLCLCVSATELRDQGYDICGGEQTFN